MESLPIAGPRYVSAVSVKFLNDLVFGSGDISLLAGASIHLGLSKFGTA